MGILDDFLRIHISAKVVKEYRISMIIGSTDMLSAIIQYCVISSYSNVKE